MLELSLEFLLGIAVVVVHRCAEVPLEVLPYAADGSVVVMDSGAACLLLDQRGCFPFAVILKEPFEFLGRKLRLAYP